MWNRFLGCPRTLQTVHWAQSYLRAENINLKNRFRHDRLLGRAVADLSSCYCCIGSYAKEKVAWDLDRFGTRASAMFQTQLGHVQPDPLAVFNRIARPRFKLGHISNGSVRVPRPRFWSRLWPRSKSFFEVFSVFFDRFLKSDQCDLVYASGTTQKPSKISF